jgi:glycosyltransferase involved in cell wall biosynthesis
MIPRPTVCVVIPCRNQARYLPTAVHSVRAQSYGVVECIVVDDGSTDDTSSVAATLGVRVFRQRHGGVSAARNVGLAAACTDLIAFLDADDELLPEAVAAEVAAFESHPEAAAVVGRCLSMDVDGRPLPTRHNVVDAANLYEQWLLRNFVWTPGAAMFRRRDLQEIGGFPVDLGPSADYAVYLRLARVDRVVFVPIELVRYRQHDASMSRDPALMLRATMKVLQRERRNAPVRARGAIRDGLDAWRQWYGEQLIERLRSDWRGGRVGVRQLRAAITLIHLCPALVMRRAAAKSRRLLSLRAAR